MDKKKKHEDIEETDMTEETDESEVSNVAKGLDDGDDEIEELRDRVDSLESQLKRAVADYHNLEKRISEGRAELSGWATSELVQKLLPVLDNLEKAVDGAGEEDQKSGWFKGVLMSVKQLKQLLLNEGLEQIRADGQFDPALHEAVDVRDGKDNEILEVLNAGYTLNGKVLRPTQVVVGRKG